MALSGGKGGSEAAGSVHCGEARRTSRVSMTVQGSATVPVFWKGKLTMVRERAEAVATARQSRIARRGSSLFILVGGLELAGAGLEDGAVP